jgi:KipI family sensor histidine kinase inhibitor
MYICEICGSKLVSISWTIAPLGDAGLLLETADDGAGTANRAALALAAALEAASPPGFVAAVPAIASLLVVFDPLRLNHADLEAQLRELISTLPIAAPESTRVVPIPVRYGGVDGPDLLEAAEALQLTPAELIAFHTAEPYRVLMIGFAPGYPYIGPLPQQLHLPRRPTPRSAVVAGSVAIAAGLSGIYPANLPGGWHLIGRTDTRLFNPAADPPGLLKPGDYVQFVAVGGP